MTLSGCRRRCGPAGTGSWSGFAAASSDGVQLVRPRAGYSASEFADDLAAADGSGRAAERAVTRLKANARMWGGTEVEGGTTGVFWQKLPRGRLFVTSGRTGDAPLVVTVSGARRPSVPPVAATVATVADGSLTLSGSSLPATGVLKVRNRGTRDHRVAPPSWRRAAPRRTSLAFFEMYVAMLTGTPATGDPRAASPFDESVFGAVTHAAAAGRLAVPALRAAGRRLRRALPGLPVRHRRLRPRATASWLRPPWADASP